jgi:hypothetical protein
MLNGQRLLKHLTESLGTGTEDQRLAAVQAVDRSCEVIAQADAWLWALVWRMLQQNLLLEVASIIWPHDLFNAEPECVKRIWHGIYTEPKLILLGCGSAGKSYSSVAWFLLDWLRDPAFTNTKVISSTAGHAKSNVFSTFTTLHNRSRVKLPGICIDGFIGLDSKNRLAGISRVSIPPGATGRAALQGFHPIPRGEYHPIWGKVGRVRALVDEAEEVPIGLWKGINNMLLSMEGRDRIKVVAACNPTDVLSPLAGQAQPDIGWTRVQLDRDKEWVSRERWKVIRIDGADLENVKERREIYPGFMTWGGYENLRLKAGGNTPEYFTMARGMYPLEGTANTVIPLSFLDQITGILMFTGRVVPCAALDVAFEGDDEVILCAGRYGQAAGWRDPQSGKLYYFEKPRYSLQVDQFFSFPKVRTLELADYVMAQCEKLGINPEWFLCDRTGVGTGLHDSLISLWDPDVAGINWGESATDKPILEDDTHLAIEECDGVATEMHMALRRWVEHGYIKLSPTVDQDKLIKEMTQRKYGLVGKGPTDLARVRVQPKKEFKALYGWSPDRCDAMVMCLHRVRMLGPERARATMTSKHRQRRGVIGVLEKGGRYIKWDPHLDGN